MNYFVEKNYIKIILLSLIVFSFILNIVLSFSILNIRSTYDDFQHFYDMYRWYEKKEFPLTGSRFELSDTYEDEFKTARVPGGAYYIYYILCYKLSNENLYAAKIINYFFCILLIYMFIFWIYKRLGLFVCSLISPLILLNGYFVKAVTNFWNPNIALIFSFIFFILLFEYVYAITENTNKNPVISSVFIFPVLAIVAQGHFASFFSVIAAMIFYLIITYKNTIKYLKYWILGVFISFLEYLPYLIAEINNGFYNTELMLSKSSETGKIIIAKIQALFLFPTNEMSSHYLSGFNNIIGFWTSEPAYIYGLIFLILSLIFSAYCLINMLYFLFKFNYKAKTINETVCIKLSKFFILSAFSTILCFFIFKFGEGYFHYLYGLFSISYIPIILFLVQKENLILHNKKIFSVLIAFLVLNSIAMFGSIDRYINKFEKRSSEYHKKYIIEFLENRKNK
ncbi:hypothetical protein [Brachyspira alvinipulli]|uniref:hypothetical protein n=1 Tax=Brachyspira alvinipulli TaxID=84379 RepID=UPI0004B37B0F|nr:hypothetical protein [Brachyspira alvinipulli]